MTGPPNLLPSGLFNGEGETLGTIPFGILLGLLALRTGSSWYGFILHAALGILTDLFIVFGAGPS